jgi:D-amino-acid dehydrogenase
LRVAIAGGGVVGLCVARWLRSGGAEVVVVERERPGAGASVGNAGWVTPALSGPLPAPGVVRTGLRWLLDPASPLRIDPRPDAGVARWLLGFMRATTASRHRAGTRALLALNERTLELFDELAQDGVELEMHRGGLLFLALGERTLAEEAAMLAAVTALGYEPPVELLSRERVRALEPAAGPDIVGGLLAPAERHVRPESLTRALARWLEAHGAEIRTGAAVEGVTPLPRGRWRLEGAGVEADAVVVAAGFWSAPLLAALGVRMPLIAAKGYSVTAAGEGLRPRRALYLVEDRVGCSPFRDEVRLAGTLELAGREGRFDRRRLGVVAGSAARYLASWRPTRPSLEWSGLRPFAPDGLPLIGPVPGHRGAFAATAHGMLGVTLGPATGAAVAEMVLDGRVHPVLEPFRLDRRL